MAISIFKTIGKEAGDFISGLLKKSDDIPAGYAKVDGGAVTKLEVLPKQEIVPQTIYQRAAATNPVKVFESFTPVVTKTTPVVTKTTPAVTKTTKLTESLEAVTKTTPDVTKTTAKAATSPLKTAAKVGGTLGVGALAGAGLTYLATSAAAATPNPDPVIIENPNDDGNTYIYNTGLEGVDEALGWLQTQIDEITSFLNDLIKTLFGGNGGNSGGEGGNGSTPFDDISGLYGGGTAGGNGGLIKVIFILGLVILIAVFVIKKLKGKKHGNGKKGGKR